ncbi:MAG TPA: ribosome recycling factor [bacterium]|nr:ribosome recycling factor [bacterium]
MLSSLDSDLKKVIDHLHNEFAKLQVGRANPALVEDVRVHAYGSVQTLKSVASVSLLDAQTIVISPWDRALLRDISAGITASGLGLNPQDNGESITIRVPQLTEERRRDLVKVAGKLAEEAKVGIRNVRQDILKTVKAAETNKEISEDIRKQHETTVQKKVDDAVKQIDEMTKHKEAEIMKV